MFYFCCSLKNLDLSNFNTNKVASISLMFSFCSSLQNLNLSNFIIHDDTNMKCVLTFCIKLNSVIVNKNNNDTLIKEINYASLKKVKPIVGTNLVEFTR